MSKFVIQFAAGLAIALAGCASSDREERRWTEDVLLEDGRTVRIERYVAFDGPPSLDVAVTRGGNGRDEMDRVNRFDGSVLTGGDPVN